MKMIDIINEVTALYRKERSKVVKMSNERLSIEQALYEAQKNEYENITAAEYMAMTARKAVLDDLIELKEHYCLGISDAREVLFNMAESLDEKVTVQN